MTFFVWYEVLHEIEASTACITLLLVPVVTTILGVIFLYEFYTEISLLGIILTLIGAYLTQSRNSKSPNEKVATAEPETVPSK